MPKNLVCLSCNKKELKLYKGLKLYCPSCLSVYRYKLQEDKVLSVLGEVIALVALSYLLYLYTLNFALFIILLAILITLLTAYHIACFKKTPSKYLKTLYVDRLKGDTAMIKNEHNLYFSNTRIILKEEALKSLEDLDFDSYAVFSKNAKALDLKKAFKSYDLTGPLDIKEDAIIVWGDEYFLSEVREQLLNVSKPLIYVSEGYNAIFNTTDCYFKKGELNSYIEYDQNHTIDYLILDVSMFYALKSSALKEALILSLTKLLLINTVRNDSPLLSSKAKAYQKALIINAERILKNSFDYHAYEEVLYMIEDDIFHDAASINLLKAALPLKEGLNISLGKASYLFFKSLINYLKITGDEETMTYLDELVGPKEDAIFSANLIDLAYEVNHAKDIEIIKNLQLDDLVEVYKGIREF